MVMENWMTEGYLCRDSVERLYSFSIVTARVFSHLSSVQQWALDMNDLWLLIIYHDHVGQKCAKTTALKK